MSEFNNRVNAQRTILRIVNRDKTHKEELFGLSSKAISRWVSINRMDPDATLVKLILHAAEKLFFLANKSQEQVTEEYMSASKLIADITNQIEIEIN